MKRILFSIGVLFIPLYSGVIYASSALPSLAKIQIFGNNRTSTAYLKKYTLYCYENIESENTLAITEQIQQCLFNSRLFTSVVVTQESPDQLAVQVDEKWTLIPVPFFAGNSDGKFSAGLLVFESNFLGLGKNIGLGAVWTSTSNNLFGFYRDNSVHFSNWRFGMLASRSKEDVEQYQSENAVNGFTEKTLLGSLSLGYQITAKFSGDVSYSHAETQNELLKNYALLPANSSINRLGLELRFKNSDYKLYFQNGFDIVTNFSQDISRSDESKPSDQETVRAQYTRLVATDHSLNFLFQAGRSRGGQIYDLFFQGNKPGFRGIPKSGSWNNSYLSLSSDYSIPLQFFSSGVWTAAIFAESGFLNSWNRGSFSPINYQSYGIGSYFFLKKIALPGIGFEIGHNTKFESLFFAFSFGVGFN